MKSVLSNWNLFRFIRLGLGVFILIQGVMTGDKFSLILGSLFTLMPVFNVGCCGAGGCGVDYKKVNSTNENINEISYEEVVDKK